MGFEQVKKVMKPSIFLSLHDDGDNTPAVFLEEPSLKEGQFDGNARNQALFPVLTPEGLKVFPASARTTLAIESAWKSIHMKPTVITRVGVAGSMHVRYAIEEAEEFAELAEKAKTIGKPAIDALMKEALKDNKGVKRQVGKRKSLI